MEEKHGHGCKCAPQVIFQLINGVQSNADIARTPNPTLREIRQSLDCLAESANSGSIVLIIAAPDGLTANLGGFVSFFDGLDSLDISFAVVNNSGIAEYTLNALIPVIDLKGAGHTDLSGPEAEFVDTIVKAGLNKLTYDHSYTLFVTS